MNDRVWFGVLAWAREIGWLMAIVTMLLPLFGPRDRGVYAAGVLVTVTLPLVLYYYATRHPNELIEMGFRTSVPKPLLERITAPTMKKGTRKAVEHPMELRRVANTCLLTVGITGMLLILLYTVYVSESIL